MDNSVSNVYKWVKEKKSSLLGHTEVILSKDKSSITASQYSMTINFIEVSDMQELQELAKNISIMWKEHETLRKAVTKKLSL